MYKDTRLEKRGVHLTEIFLIILKWRKMGKYFHIYQKYIPVIYATLFKPRIRRIKFSALVQFPPTAISRTSLSDINKKLFYLFLYMLNSLCSIFSLCMLIHIDVELQIESR